MICHNVHIACGYHLVKMELEIQTRFLPRLPFFCNSIISDKIWRKMSLSLSIFLVLPQISLVKYYKTIKNIDANILIFQIPFSQCCWPRRKKLFWGFFLSIKKSACVLNLKFLRHPQQVFFPNNCLILDKYVMGIFFLQILSIFSPVSAGIIIFWSKLSKN